MSTYIIYDTTHVLQACRAAMMLLKKPPTPQTTTQQQPMAIQQWNGGIQLDHQSIQTNVQKLSTK